MKKITLIILNFIFLTSLTMAQTNKVRCGAASPSTQWDESFNQLVETYKAEHPYQESNFTKSKATTTYLIPIVFHIIYGTQKIGTYPNLSNAQVTSQIQILNDDFQGKGYNSNQYATMGSGGHLPFYNYSVSNSLPAPNNNGVAIGNLSIEFRAAWKKPNGDTLTELGIDRVSYSAKGWSNPTSFTNEIQFQNYFDNTIKPGTIWDPSKYLNIWVSDCSSSVQILGYSSFPPGTTLTGLGSGVGTATTDGTWIWAQACGNTGTLFSGYDHGRTLTHELGHYLGLRHTWGDATCGNDYCNDVPPSQTANYNAWPVSYPFNASTCTGTGLYKSNATDGEMFMNFMDYCEDAALWMFTNDQVTRMNTALTQSNYRKSLTASAILVCKPDFIASNNSIDKKYLDYVINVFPNPTHDKLNISTSFAEPSNIKIELSNLIGQKIMMVEEKNITTANLFYDISKIAKGTYFITITNQNNTMVTKKLMVE